MEWLGGQVEVRRMPGTVAELLALPAFQEMMAHKGYSKASTAEIFGRMFTDTEPDPEALEQIDLAADRLAAERFAADHDPDPDDSGTP
jgi:hypothetical protein